MIRSILFRLSIIAAIIALVTMACQIPFLSSLTGGTERRETPEKEADLPHEEEEAPDDGIEPKKEVTPEEMGSAPGGIDWGEAVPDGITSNGEGTAGEIIGIVVHNPSDKPTTVEIPCGLVFNPPEGSGEQKLMVIQAVVEEIPAGSSAELTPYVVCIESSASAPGEGSAYTVGEMVTEAGLLKLSDCLCKEKLEPGMAAFQEMMGIQFATWMAAGDLDLDELNSAEGGAMGELLKSFGDMMQVFTEPAQQWLDKCGIEQ